MRQGRKERRRERTELKALQLARLREAVMDGMCQSSCTVQRLTVGWRESALTPFCMDVGPSPFRCGLMAWHGKVWAVITRQFSPTDSPMPTHKSTRRAHLEDTTAAPRAHC